MKGHAVKRKVWVVDFIQNCGRDEERTYRYSHIFYCEEDAQEFLQKTMKEDLEKGEYDQYFDEYDDYSVEMTFWEI